jgi:O-antigen/teichoic acid export membrane protein
LASVRRKIALNIIYLTTGQGISFILASLVVLVVPAYLGPTGMGLFSIVNAIGGFVAVVALLGTNVFILREVARDQTAAYRLVGSAILLCIIAGLICWGIAALAITLSDGAGTLHVILYITAVGSILSISTVPLRSALQGLDKMQYTLFEILLTKGLYTVLALGVVALNLGLVILVSVNLLTIIPIVALYWWAFLKNTRTKVAKNIAVYTQLIKGGYYFLVTDISFNVYLYLDTMLLATLTSEKMVGYYSVPVRLFGTALTAPVIVGQALLPTLSRTAASSEAQNLLLGRKLLQFLLCVSIPAAIGITIMADPFITFFYKAEFAASVPVFIVLGWTTIPTYLGIGLYQILVSQNRQKNWAKIMVMAIFANLGLNLVLIPFYQANMGNGAFGAALSQFLTELLIGIIGIRLVGFDIFNKELAFMVLKALAASLVMALVIFPLRLVYLPIPLIVGVLVYGLLAIPLFGLSPFIKQAWQRIPFPPTKAAS